jgi:3-oxoacyl-[acyl-carrier-protein] synthase-3
MEQLVSTKTGQECLQRLLNVWFDFDLALSKVPVIKRLEQYKLSQPDYQKLLLNLRQQVIEGSRWITRCASSFDRDHSDIRSVVIHHAKDEHRDYLMLEQDYVTAGGDITNIQSAPKNIGSEALHGYLMYRASLPNPTELVGAMWIIEGLGNKMAGKWASLVDEQFGAEPSMAMFMKYHGENDEHHINELYELIDKIAINQDTVDAIVKNAQVVARLYALQLEEVDHV